MLAQKLLFTALANSINIVTHLMVFQNKLERFIMPPQKDKATVVNIVIVVPTLL